MFLERVSKGATEGIRRVGAFMVNDVIDEDEASIGTDGGGGVVIEPSRSLLIELDVCAA
jgi:hypothetical protein